jgi:hypothetical protein
MKGYDRDDVISILGKMFLTTGTDIELLKS